MCICFRWKTCNHIHPYGTMRYEAFYQGYFLTVQISFITATHEVNTFEWVIETLVDVCQHSEQQAEQCAYIIHFKGKYAVKQGSYDELKPLREAISERGIGATVESMVH